MTEKELKEAVELKIDEINILIEQNKHLHIQFRFMTWVGMGTEHNLKETSQLLDDTLQFKKKLRTNYLKDDGKSV